MSAERGYLRRAAPALLAGAGGVALGLALATDAAPPDGTAAVPRTPEGVERTPGRPRLTPERGPRQVGARSAADGPVAAATTHFRALADERLLGAPDRRQAVASRVATAGYRAELAGRLDAAYGALEARWPTGTRALFRVYPLGYRVEHRERERATVAVWSAVIHPGSDGAPAVVWTLSRAALVRTRSGWRLERYLADEPGPAPASPAAGTAADDFAAAAATFSPYRR